MHTKEQATGQLFGKLFPAYDDVLFLASMELLAKRFQANNFPLDWFKGKRCLDVGCGGGRYTLALAGLGAEHVSGIDIGEAGIADAKKRAAAMGVTNVDFQVGSVLNLPFENEAFDCVIFSGVLQHVAEPATALRELSRVVKPGGMLYLLVYATEGMRWPLVQMLRPIAMSVGFPAMDRAVADAGLAANRRRTYLDDLFVPYIDFYSWERLRSMLMENGFTKLDRWQKGRLDHEENLEAYLKDLGGFQAVMDAAAASSDPGLAAHKTALQAGSELCANTIAFVQHMKDLADSGAMTEQEAMQTAIGQGHHRVVAWKT